MKCKYADLNSKERKCNDYYIHRRSKYTIKEQILNELGDSIGLDVYMCRFPEWKKKKKVCPYNPNIKSCSKRTKGQKILK